MKENKKPADSEIWSQLVDKIKEADNTKRKNMMELQDKIHMIIGKKDLKVKIPKNEQSFLSLGIKTC